MNPQIAFMNYHAHRIGTAAQRHGVPAIEALAAYKEIKEKKWKKEENNHE
ncbi:hypothetical protein [Xylella fastidiosa]|nr:hypothetical protein [Xylella fastidiosa]WGZ34707.1 hypothetical protein O4445_02010 [Xylella fastidiosa subsp. pauca]WGZ36986.1 hypothetical protein O4443_02005 [Xylella fastidiosa subsp. pauca]